MWCLTKLYTTFLKSSASPPMCVSHIHQWMDVAIHYYDITALCKNIYVRSFNDTHKYTSHRLTVNHTLKYMF